MRTGHLLERARGALRVHYAVGRNPLRRSSDRVEAAVLLMLTVLGLVAVVLALMVAMLAFRQLGARADSQRAALHRVDATVIANPSTAQWARDRVLTWIDASGRRRTYDAWVPGDTRIGDHLTVWLDATGEPAVTPQSAGDVAVTATAAGLGVAALALGALVLAARATNRFLDRGRHRALDAEWRRFNRAPSSHRPPEQS
ncbi:hypothetical protein ACIB24_10030 [Spongisporangium articulatum]|uniref:Transmembrane protein n=1 Tax=Spongisporangium articulatum TaxID=3362603 RepID=A0ABW8ALZ1_9ACTN